MSSSAKPDLSELMSVYLNPSHSGICNASMSEDKFMDETSEPCTKPATLIADVRWCDDDSHLTTTKECFTTLGHKRSKPSYVPLCDEHGAIIRAWPALFSIRTLAPL